MLQSKETPLRISDEILKDNPQLIVQMKQLTRQFGMSLTFNNGACELHGNKDQLSAVRTTFNDTLQSCSLSQHLARPVVDAGEDYPGTRPTSLLFTMAHAKSEEKESEDFKLMQNRLEDSTSNAEEEEEEEDDV
jgi:hypothetical protein